MTGIRHKIETTTLSEIKKVIEEEVRNWERKARELERINGSRESINLQRAGKDALVILAGRLGMELQK